VRRNAISAVVYAATAYSLAEFLDGLYGMGPFTGPVKLIYLAIAGTVLFFLACILSLFTWRVGAFCAVVGSAFSWPLFALPIQMIRWRRVLSILSYSNWSDLLVAIFALGVSTVYSAIQMRRPLRRTGERRMVTKLALALIYDAGILVSMNWRGIADWLFRLRYGS
jgi:hypothetical protein